MARSGELKSQLTNLERQIGDKERQIQFDDTEAERERQRLQMDIDDAQQHIARPETEPGQHQSWQNRLSLLQSQLQQETQKMQSTRQMHQSELQSLRTQQQELLRQIPEAERREMIRLIIDAAA